MLEGNDRLASEFEYLGDPDDENAVVEKCIGCGGTMIKCAHCDAYEEQQ